MFLKKEKPFIIGIAGSTASGKTTICSKLLRQWGEKNCLILSCDNYYKDISHLPLKKIEKTNFDHPDSLDFDLLMRHIQQLKAGVSVEMPLYNFKTHAREVTTITVHPKPYIVLEGILVLHVEKIRALFDYRIFVDTNPKLALERRLQRDCKERGLSKEQVLKQYKETVWPMYRKYIHPTREFAHLVIDNSQQDLHFDVKKLASKIACVKEKGISPGISPLREFHRFFQQKQEPVMCLDSIFVSKL